MNEERHAVDETLMTNLQMFPDPSVHHGFINVAFTHLLFYSFNYLASIKCPPQAKLGATFRPHRCPSNSFIHLRPPTPHRQTALCLKTGSPFRNHSLLASFTLQFQVLRTHGNGQDVTAAGGSFLGCADALERNVPENTILWSLNL